MKIPYFTIGVVVVGLCGFGSSAVQAQISGVSVGVRPSPVPLGYRQMMMGPAQAPFAAPGGGFGQQPGFGAGGVRVGVPQVIVAPRGGFGGAGVGMAGRGGVGIPRVMAAPGGAMGGQGMMGGFGGVQGGIAAGVPQVQPAPGALGGMAGQGQAFGPGQFR